jgi:hypothetical protein
MSDLESVRQRVDPASKAAAARLVAAIADHDHTTTAEILGVANASEVARWLATQAVADRWVRDPRGYRERLRRRAESEMTRAQREFLAERHPR